MATVSHPRDSSTSREASLVPTTEETSSREPFLSAGAKAGFIIAAVVIITAVGVIIAAATGNFALLASNSVAFVVMEAVTGVVAALQIIVYVCLGIIYRHEKQELKKLRQDAIIESDIDEESDVEDQERSEGADNLEEIENEAPLSKQEWNQKLQNAQKQVIDKTTLFNLDTNKSLPKTPYDFLPLPILECQDKGAVLGGASIATVVRLPNSQLAAFPKIIRDQIAKAKKNNKNLEQECYFMVFRKPKDSNRANLLMHPAVFHDINLTLDKATGIKEGVTPHEGGFNADSQIVFCDPKGLKRYDKDGRAFNPQDPTHKEENYCRTSKHEQTRLVIDGQRDFNKWEDRLFIHQKQGAPSGVSPSFSPKTAEIEIEDGATVSSFSTAAFFRGKAVAIHAIVLNDEATGEGKSLAEALAKPNLSQFLQSLKDTNFIYFHDIENFLVPNLPEVDDNLEADFWKENLQTCFKLAANQLGGDNPEPAAEFIVEQYKAIRQQREPGFQLGNAEKKILVKSVTKRFRKTKPGTGDLTMGNKKLHIFPTLGDGSCGLHALRGELVKGSYKTNASADRKEFCDRLRQLKQENKLPSSIVNVLEDYFSHFNLAPNGFKTEKVLIKYAEYRNGYDALSKEQKDAKRADFVNDPVIFEAYLKNLQDTRVHLLQEELIAAAECFGMNLVLYQPGWGKDSQIGRTECRHGSDEDETIAVWHNGFNHYQRAEDTDAALVISDEDEDADEEDT
jgi:hypothetical protein